MGIGAGAARIRRRNGHAELGWLIIGSCDTRLRDRHGRLIRGGDEWANSRVATCWARPRPAAAATSTETLGQGQPSFRFQLGAVAPKTWDGGWAKEATVTQFPVS